jgi:hypothetical protein
MLGHTNLIQTSPYLNATGDSLQAAMKALDERSPRQSVRQTAELTTARRRKSR